MRIASIQPTASDIRLLTNEQSAAQVRQGDQNIWIGFYGENLGATEEPVHVGIRGSGIRTGITQFREKQFGNLDAWILQVSVADDAPLGLRSFYIRRGDEIAYANGFIDVRPSIPDFNQDGLNDDFQRTFYTRWTSPSAKPLADSDRDQYSNAEEYEAGSNPTLATSNPVTVLPLSPFWMFRWMNKGHGFVLKANQACAINSMVERMWMAMHGPPEVRRSRQQRGSHSYTTPQIMICSPSTESRCSHAETHRSAAEVEVDARWEEEEKGAKPACCGQEEVAH